MTPLHGDSQAPLANDHPGPFPSLVPARTLLRFLLPGLAILLWTGATVRFAWRAVENPPPAPLLRIPGFAIWAERAQYRRQCAFQGQFLAVNERLLLTCPLGSAGWELVRWDLAGGRVERRWPVTPLEGDVHPLSGLHLPPALAAALRLPGDRVAVVVHGHSAKAPLRLIVLDPGGGVTAHPLPGLAPGALVGFFLRGKTYELVTTQGLLLRLEPGGTLREGTLPGLPKEEGISVEVAHPTSQGWRIVYSGPADGAMPPRYPLYLLPEPGAGTGAVQGGGTGAVPGSGRLAGPGAEPGATSGTEPEAAQGAGPGAAQAAGPGAAQAAGPGAAQAAGPGAAQAAAPLPLGSLLDRVPGKTAGERLDLSPGNVLPVHLGQWPTHRLLEDRITPLPSPPASLTAGLPRPSLMGSQVIRLLPQRMERLWQYSSTALGPPPDPGSPNRVIQRWRWIGQVGDGWLSGERVGTALRLDSAPAGRHASVTIARVSPVMQALPASGGGAWLFDSQGTVIRLGADLSFSNRPGLGARLGRLWRREHLEPGALAFQGNRPIPPDPWIGLADRWALPVILGGLPLLLPLGLLLSRVGRARRGQATSLRALLGRPGGALLGACVLYLALAVPLFFRFWVATAAL